MAIGDNFNDREMLGVRRIAGGHGQRRPGIESGFGWRQTLSNDDDGVAASDCRVRARESLMTLLAPRARRLPLLAACAIACGCLLAAPAARADYAVLRNGQRLHVTSYENLGTRCGSICPEVV